MKLPNGDRAVIDLGKILDYLLSPEHPVGRYKAAWFQRLGFTRSSWQTLVAELQTLAAQGDVAVGDRTVYGQKYAVRGMITSPTARAAAVVSIWIILDGEDLPRFVTAFPEE